MFTGDICHYGYMYWARNSFHIDSLTVSLHSSNSRPVQGDSQWPQKNSKNSNWSFKPTIHCDWGNPKLFYHLNHCWLLISEVWPPEGNFTGNAQDSYHWYLLKITNQKLPITASSSVGQWVYSLDSRTYTSFRNDSRSTISWHVHTTSISKSFQVPSLLYTLQLEYH